jgi:membrane fusion protein, macrolide-specific efflux system
MKLKVLAVVALGAVGVAAVVYALGGVPTGSASTTAYLTSAATNGDVTNDVAATGTLQPQAQFGLVFGADPYLLSSGATAPSSTTAWPVKEVKATVGATVAKGDVLATADTADLRRALVAAENDLGSARVSLSAAKTSLSDAKDANVTAQIQQARIGLNSAQNGLADAQQKVIDLKTQIKQATLVAPVDGTVTAVNLVPGFDAPSGDGIVLDATGFQVTTDVVESDLADLKVGQPASISVSAVDATIDGTVAAISPTASSDSSGGTSVVSYPVTITLTKPPATLRSGMSADVTITIASASNVLTVPAAALRGTTGDYTVLVLGADGQPTPQAVQVGLVTNTSAEITSGLTEGQAVVTGTSAARTGTTVTGGFGGGVAIPGGGGFGGNFRRNTNGN